MCGIAGYHCSPTVVGTLFGDKTPNELAEIGLKANAHRGRMATGIFTVEDDKTYVQKSNVDADKFMQTILSEIDLGRARILACHTRAATKGSASDNNNNHPVRWGNVLVTHNGTIGNDEPIKAAVAYQQKPRPEVDTAAISAALNNAGQNPEENFDEVLAALSSLRGSFAIHAVWILAPGWSLLARGPSSPLHFYYDEKGIFLYSSEVSGVQDLMKHLGLEGDVRQLNVYTALLLHDGVPVKWGRIPDPIMTGRRVVRQAPSGARWVATEASTYYASGDKPWHIGQDNSAVLLWEDGEYVEKGMSSCLKDMAGQPLADRDFKLPTTHSALMSSLAEADKVMRFSFLSKQRDFVSVWYGNVEIIVDTDGIIQDVFDWSKDYQRFLVEDVKPEQSLTLEEFWTQCTMKAVASTIYPPRHNTGRQVPFQGQLPVAKATVDNSVKAKDMRPDGLPSALFAPYRFIAVNEMGNMLRSRKQSELPLLLNEKCPIHHQWTPNHTKPDDCEFMQMAALAAMGRCSGIVGLLAMTRGGVSVATKIDDPTKSCAAHSWRSESKLEFPIRDGKLINVHLPYLDKCRECGAERRVLTWTNAITNYIERNKLNAPV